MKTLTICGSMRFEDQMCAIAWDLETKHGFCVLQCIFSGDAAVTEADRQALAEAHFQKIRLSDGIYVVDIGGYVGESVRTEIAFARELGKEVIFHSGFAQD